MKFGLVENFAFYTAYHNDPVNKVIHMFCIPLITWTVAIFLSYVFIVEVQISEDAIFFTREVDHLGTNMFPVNGALIIALCYSVYYLHLEFLAGLIMTTLLFGFWASAAYLREVYEYTWLIAIGVHILAWALQFVGHGVFEKRKPALMDSLGQAFLMAPMFVVLELLFLCGYRPNLQRRIESIRYSQNETVQ